MPLCLSQSPLRTFDGIPVPSAPVSIMSTFFFFFTLLGAPPKGGHLPAFSGNFLLLLVCGYHIVETSIEDSFYGSWTIWGPEAWGVAMTWHGVCSPDEGVLEGDSTLH